MSEPQPEPGTWRWRVESSDPVTEARTALAAWDQHNDNGYELAAALRALLAPPTDDERAVAEARWPVTVKGYSDDGTGFYYESPTNRNLREAFYDGLRVRRPGPITDEDRAAAWDEGYEAGTENQADYEGHRYNAENTPGFTDTPNPYRAGA